MIKFICAFLFMTTALFAEPKVVLISGACSGIGLATAKEFQARGWKVWAGYHHQIAEELKLLDRVRLCPLDVTNEEQINITIETILKEDGRLDAVINNAGYGVIGVEESISIEQAQQLFDVNFFGVLRLIQASLPIMRDQKSGHIVNISSGMGVHSLPGLGMYASSKHALEALSESLAATLNYWNIKVSIVEPGFVKNDWGKHIQKGAKTIQEEYYRKFNDNLCSWLSVSRGQPKEEVAKLIADIAENPQPNVRYQTTQEMTQGVKSRLMDDTGNAAFEKNLRFIQERLK